MRHWLRKWCLQHPAKDLPLLTALFSQVGGSDLVKQQEQLATPATNVTSLFDFCFAENGLTAFRLGKPMSSNSFIQWLGEEKYQKLVNFVLGYLSKLTLPKKRGTFMEFRNGMVNISPIGRNASVEERHEFEKYDRPSWVDDLVLCIQLIYWI